MYLPATQLCTVTSTTSYRVPTGYWLHSLVHLLQQLVTECTDRLPAKQPCTGYSMSTALYSSLNWLQCTGYTALYTGFNNWLQSLPAGTGYTALYTCFILWVTSLLTGCWLHSPYCTVLQPNWFIKKKKKKKKLAKYRPVAVKIHW